MHRVAATFFLFLLLFPRLGYSAEDPWNYKAPFQNAVISYDVSGSATGTETLYLRKSGREMAMETHTETKILFMSSEDNKVVITTPEKIILIDLDKKTANRRVNPTKYMHEQYTKLSSAEKDEVMKNATKMGTMVGGTFTENAKKIEGYDCDKSTVLGITSYNIHKTPITLETTGGIAGFSVEKRVASIKLEAPHSKAFDIPEGFAVTDATKEEEQQAKEMALATLNWLKDPESGEQMEQAKKDYEEGMQEQEDQPGSEEGSEEGENNSGQDEKMKKAKELLGKGLEGLKDLW